MMTTFGHAPARVLMISAGMVLPKNQMNPATDTRNS
jgi:hypothetical protein